MNLPQQYNPDDSVAMGSAFGFSLFSSNLTEIMATLCLQGTAATSDYWGSIKGKCMAFRRHRPGKALFITFRLDESDAKSHGCVVYMPKGKLTPTVQDLVDGYRLEVDDEIFPASL